MSTTLRHRPFAFTEQPRRFNAEYKVRILREVDRAKAPGDIGAILPREGLYSSLLTQWRRDRDRVARAGLAARKRGPKRKAEDPRIKQLEREKKRLERKLEQAETIIAIQKNSRARGRTACWRETPLRVA